MKRSAPPSFALPAALLGLALCATCSSAAATNHRDAPSASRAPAAELHGDVLALFLTRLAQAAADGDPGRVAAFLDDVTELEFYESYGLARFNERVSGVVYDRYLAAYAQGKPRLVGSMMRSGLVITTGTALPMIVEGRFEGRVFAVSAASLGISTAAVKTGAAAIDWVRDLREVEREGTLARFGAKAGSIARLNGWFYQVAEQAVIIYFTERIEPEIRRALDERAWRAELVSEIEAFLGAIGGDGAPGDALAAYHESWIRYRNHFYEAVDVHEKAFDECLAKVARGAKVIADAETKAAETLPNHPALAERLRSRHGSIDAYTDRLFRQKKARLDESFAGCLERYNAAREELLAEIYERGRRNTPLLASVEHRDRVLARALAGEGAGALADALESVSANRIESYDDEIEILGAVARVLREQGRNAAAAVVDERIDAVDRLKELDRRLYRGNGLVETGG